MINKHCVVGCYTYRESCRYKEPWMSDLGEKDIVKKTFWHFYGHFSLTSLLGNKNQHTGLFTSWLVKGYFSCFWKTGSFFESSFWLSGAMGFDGREEVLEEPSWRTRRAVDAQTVSASLWSQRMASEMACHKIASGPFAVGGCHRWSQRSLKKRHKWC